MKHFLQSILNNAGYEVRRRRDLKVDYFNALANFQEVACEAADDLARRFLVHATRELLHSHAQRLQDLLADFVMGGRSGVFCEFGATDGVTYSNTHFLQYRRGWTGLLAEPSRAWHADLASNRPGAVIDHRCVYARSGEMIQFNQVEAGELSGIASLHGKDRFAKERKQGRHYMVETVSLVDLLRQHGITSLDYLSVDTEGSELVILQGCNFDRFRPKLVTVEHNYTSAREKITHLMETNGYRLIFADYSAFDAWYVLPECLAEI